MTARIEALALYVTDAELAADAVEVLGFSEGTLAIYLFAADARIRALVDEMTGTTWQPTGNRTRTEAGDRLWRGEVANPIAEAVRASSIERAAAIFAGARSGADAEVTLDAPAIGGGR